MTCIVGLKHNGVVYMGADSLGVLGGYKTLIMEKKVFKDINCDEFLIGFSGWLNTGLIRYESLIDENDIIENKIDKEYIFTKFLSRLKDTVAKFNIISQSESLSYLQGGYLVSYVDQLYEIDNAFGIREVSDYIAIGSGAGYAMGSLYSTDKLTNNDPYERIRISLECASTFETGVAGPFYILNTKNNDIINYPAL